MAKGTKKLKPKKPKSPSTKNTKRLCKSTCYAITNLELTSSRILLSLLSLNSYTSIASAITLRMLSKQKNYTQFYFLKIMSPELDDRIPCMEDFCKCTKMSMTPRRRRYFIQSLPVSILRELALQRGVSPTSNST